jgi:16S rRNA (uracil1498-N3)-methyltransferase
VSNALFYVDALPAAGELAVVDGDEGFHASTVRRLRPGERIDLSDGAGALAHCVVEDAVKGRLTARVESVRSLTAPQPAVTVVQALPKSERSELAIELATEAGADGFTAWQAARCVARWDGAAKVDKGLRRWRAVARAAARQSRRPYVPDVDAVVSTADLVRRVADVTAEGGLALALHEAAGEPLVDVDLDGRGSLLLIVGPEGGISDDEIADLRAAGALAVRLGPSVLRTSTAAAVALGALGALTSRWRG